MNGNDIDSALSALKLGRVILLEDDATSPAVAFLVCAAQTITPQTIVTMSESARGVVCAAVSEPRLRQLGLAPMASRNSSNAPDFTVTVEARRGVTTGISAADRAVTLQVLATTKEARFDLVKPGHIFPMRAKQGGVLVRAAAAEGAVDLLDLAFGFGEAGVAPSERRAGESSNVAAICQCLNAEGRLLQGTAVRELAATCNFPLVSLSQIIQRRLETETIIERIASAELPVEQAGEFKAVCFRSWNDGAEHLALVRGDVDQSGAGGDPAPVLVRVQAENRLGDLLGTKNSGSRKRIDRALRSIASADKGVFVYVRHARQGLLRAQLAQQARSQGGGAVEGLTPILISQVREIGIGSQILTALGIRRVSLLTNSAWHAGSLAAFRLEVAGTVKLGD